MLALTTACHEAVTPPKPVDPPITFRAPELIVSDTATADGASVLPIAVAIDTTTPPDKRAIVLNTTSGVFAATNTATTTVNPDADGIARSLLRAPADSTSVLVTATVNGMTSSRTIVYHRAAPDAIDVVPDQFALQAGSGHELQLTAYLRRVVGKPSPGLRVTFTAVDSVPPHLARGAFLPTVAVSDANGLATARYTLPDTTQRSPVIVRATVNPSGVFGETMIKIIGTASSVDSTP